MKVTNRGHEFDEHGNYYKDTHNFYIYGTNLQGEILCTNMNWIIERCQAKNDIIIQFVDHNEQKQMDCFCGCEVISQEVFKKKFCKTGNDIVVLMLAEADNAEICRELQKDKRVIKNHNLFTEYDFSRYIPVLIWYKYQKLYFGLVDIFMSSFCNLKCDGCLICTWERRERQGMRKLEPTEFMKNLDMLFSKVDFIGELIFGVAESFTYDHLAEIFDYTRAAYGNRINKITVVTNGSIILSDETLESMNRNDVNVIIDDYRDTVPLCQENHPKLIEALNNHKVINHELKRAYWDNMQLGSVNNSSMSEDELCTYMDTCQCGVTSFPFFGYDSDKMYRCLLPILSKEFDILEETQNDFVRLSNTSPIEIIEYILGFTEKGYLNACTICPAVHNGQTEQRIPVAVQRESKKK